MSLAAGGAKTAQERADARPLDMAMLVVWRKGLANPTQFNVLEADGREAVRLFEEGKSLVQFVTYPDGGGRRSASCFLREDVAGLTLEYATIAFGLGH